MTYINKGDHVVKADQLFVYGIFLGAARRAEYGMTNPKYDTVPDYITVGNYIVQAVPVPNGNGVQLTGLVVDIDPDYWPDIDALEAGYDRITVTTNSHGEAYMYAAPRASLEKEEAHEQEIEA